MNEALPQAPVEDRAFAADMVMTVMSAVGERISEQARSESAVNAMAVAIGEMFCAYLEGIKYPRVAPDNLFIRVHRDRTFG